MKHILLSLIFVCTLQVTPVYAQNNKLAIDSVLPVRGLAIEAPSVKQMDLFLKFIEEELAPAHFNLLILRIDWNYAYKSHPELKDPNPLTESDVKKLVSTCRKHGIKLAPQINLLAISHGQKQPMLYCANIPNLMKHPMSIRKIILDGLIRMGYIVKAIARSIPTFTNRICISR